MLDASSRDEVLGVIAWMYTFSPAKMWIRGMEVLSKPLLYMAIQANVEIPWDSIDMDFMNLNQAAHGDREYAYILTRLGVVRTTVVGHASNPKAVGRVTWDFSVHVFRGSYMPQKRLDNRQNGGETPKKHDILRVVS